MILNLSVNQLSPAGIEWLSRYLSAAESRDPDSVIALFHDQAMVQVNDGVPLQSHLALLGLFQRYFANFSRVEHEVLNAYGSDSEFVAEMLCHYTLAASGKRVTIPGATIHERDDDGLLISLRIYLGFVGMFEAFDAAADMVRA